MTELRGKVFFSSLCLQFWQCVALWLLRIENSVYLPRSLRLVRQSLSEDAEEGLLLLVRASQEQLPVTL